MHFVMDSLQGEENNLINYIIIGHKHFNDPFPNALRWGIEDKPQSRALLRDKRCFVQVLNYLD